MKRTVLEKRQNGFDGGQFRYIDLVRFGGQAANCKMRDKAGIKMKANTVLIVVALLAYWVGLSNSSAFYDPCMQRWLNRDSLGERGFEALRGGRAGRIVANLYIFIGNNAIGKTDPDGLKIWVCTVHADPPFPKWSTHSYFWDDRPGTKDINRECGKEGSSGSGGNSSNNIGPSNGETANPWHGTGPKGPTECYQVDDSDGKEQAVMDCCHANANKGTFVPYANDCHDTVDNCLKENGLSSPPHSRGDPISNHAKDIQCECSE